jgi:hypothetical protein
MALSCSAAEDICAAEEDPPGPALNMGIIGIIIRKSRSSRFLQLYYPVS